MNITQATVLRALRLGQVLDVEHTCEELHKSFRAVRHELETLRRLHVPEAFASTASPELRSARIGRGTQPGGLRHEVLERLSVTPLADFQVAKRLDIDAQAVRRRRHELVAAGWVEVVLVGDKARKARQPGTGRECTVYRITDLGMAALTRLRSGQEVLFSDAELGNDSDTTPDKSRGCDVMGTYEVRDDTTVEAPQ